MNPILKNIIGVLVGVIVFMLVNGFLIQISGSIIPYPEGYDPSDMDSVTATIHLLETKHFIMPFLAHALGTIIGALLTVKIVATRKMTFAMVIGFLGMLGGIAAVMMIPGPTWFAVVDLVLAYIPMAWLGWRLGR